MGRGTNSPVNTTDLNSTFFLTNRSGLLALNSPERRFQRSASTAGNFVQIPSKYNYLRRIITNYIEKESPHIERNNRTHFFSTEHSILTRHRRPLNLFKRQTFFLEHLGWERTGKLEKHIAGASLKHKWQETKLGYGVRGVEKTALSTHPYISDCSALSFDECH